jgi:hypothetical protein
VITQYISVFVMSNLAPLQGGSLWFRSIQNSARFVFARGRAILDLKNALKFSPSDLQFNDQRTKLVHNFFCFFRDYQLLVGRRYRITSAAKQVIKSGTPRRLVPTIVFGIRSLLIGSIRAYQSRAESSGH